MGLAGRRRGRRGRRSQILDLRWLRWLVVDSVRLECWRRLEVLVMDRWRVRREHRDRSGSQQRLPSSRCGHLRCCCHLRRGHNRHGFPNARRLAGVRVLLRGRECGLLRLQRHVRHDDWLRGDVLLARVGALLLHQHRSRCLWRVRA